MSSTAVLSLKAYDGETIQVVYDDYGHQYARRVSKDKSSSTNWVSSDAEISRLLHSSIKSKDYSTPNERVTEIESDVKSSTDLLNEVSKKTDHLYDQLKGSLTGLKVNGVVTSSDQLPSDSSNGDVYLVNDLIYIRSAGKWIEAGSYRGPQGNQGIPGPGLDIRGSVTSVGDLPSSGQNGYAYFVGSTVYAWIDTKWISVGDIAPDLSKYPTTDLMNKSIDEKIANYDSTSFHESDTSNYQKKKITTDAGQPLTVINSGDDLSSKIKSLSSTTGFGTIFISGSSVGNSLSTDLSGTFISDGNSVIISAVTPTLDSVRIKGTPTGDPSWESSHDKVIDNHDGTEQLNGVKVQPFNKLRDSVGGRNLLINTAQLNDSTVCLDNKSNTPDTYLGLNIYQTNYQFDGVRIYWSYLAPKIKTNMDYVMSEYVRNTSPTTSAGIGIFGNVNGIVFNSQANYIFTTLPPNSGWIRISELVNVASFPTKISDVLRFENATTLNDGYVQFAGLKFEQGSIATDWTPAPEDKQDKIGYTPADDSKVVHSTDLSNYVTEISVKSFGAVGDGVTDDTKAIQTAISTAQSGNVKCVYFPAGKYLTTLTNQIISGISICGENRMTSTIISDTSDPVFLVGTNSTIKSLGFHSNVATSNTMIGIGKSSPTDVAEWNITLEDLRFDSIEYPDPTKKAVGGWGLRPINFVLDNLGLWDVTVRNVSMQYVYSGMNIDTINGGWLTGSLFDNIVVKGFDHHAFGIISSNHTLTQVSQCVFSNLIAQVLYETHGDDASGFIVAGGGNEFDNLRLFNDGTYNKHALTLRFFGKDEKFKQFPSFAQGTTTSNTFSGGTLEGYIYDPDNLKSFQSFVHLKTQVAPKTGSMQNVNVANETFENLLSKDGFLKNIVGDLQNNLPSDSVVTTGLDKFGQFIDISLTNTDASFDYIISDPAGTLNAIKDDAFSIGLRFRDMTESNTSALTAYIRFNDKDYKPTENSFENVNRYSDIQERVWCCEPMTDDFNKITSFKGNNRVVFYIAKNSRVRIYRCMLVSGRTTDFSNVVENSISNIGSAGATPRLPSGTDLNYLVGNLIQFSGTYLVDNTNRPADTPKEFGNDPFIITITPGLGSNHGMISLMDSATNTMLIAGVNSGNLGAWITLHA